MKQVLDVHKAIANFYREIPDDYFSSPAIPDGWTVRRNMKHVISTNFGFGIWIGLPRSLKNLKSPPKSKQPSVEDLKPTNRFGVLDYGKYEKTKISSKKKKEKLIQMIISSAEKLNRKINMISEEDLDTLPGLFGGLSLRTFILYLLKHNIHHTNVVRLRLENS